VAEIPLKVPQSGERVGRASAGMLMGCAPEKFAGGARLQGSRAPAGVCGDDSRRGLLQRLEGHERGCDHQGAGVVSGEHPSHSCGKDKGSDYSVLNDLLQKRVKGCTRSGGGGEDRSQIKGTEVVHAEILENALRKANAVAQEGRGAVGSGVRQFDQFKNYEQRGGRSKRLCGRWRESSFSAERPKKSETQRKFLPANAASNRLLSTNVIQYYCDASV